MLSRQDVQDGLQRHIDNGELAHDNAERLSYYIDYNHTVEDFGDLVERMEEWAIDEEEAYVGEFDDEATFAEEIANDLATVPDWIVVDWDATWDYYLQHDYFNNGGYFWRNI